MDTDLQTPTGEYSKRQVPLIAAALTGDTGTIQKRLDEITNDES